MNSNDLEFQMPSNLRDGPESVPLRSVSDSPSHIQSDSQPKRRGILKLTVETPTGSSFPKTVDLRPLPRWRTPEFMFYGLVFAIVVPIMVWKPVYLSRASHPNYHLYSGRLSDGWIFGRKIDNSDAQYRSFRNNVPLLTLIASAFLALKYAYLALRRRLSPSIPGTLLYQIPFQLFISLLFLLGLHGANILKILIIFSLNYGIAKGFKPSKLTLALTWVFNTGILFAIERNSGYQFARISPSLSYLDSLQGAYPRWFIPFNFSMLRLVSFNMDYYWAYHLAGPSSPESHMTHRHRTATPHDLNVYSFMNYIVYLSYPPLFLAGPIMTFNDFMWQYTRPISTPSGKMVIQYFFRFLACFLTMELILHYMYLVAIKDAAAWKGDTPFELSMVGFWNLIIVWLKLLLPWRFFRLWALADGIDPPENMIRCMVNNYSALGFWKAWHRSYNLWIVRYIYIPLGGSKNRLACTALIFTFVALWHDLTFKLLAWGWLVSLFVVPEVTAQYFLPPSKYGNRTWYRHACAAGGVGNAFMMMTANLVGFVVGVDGMKYMIQQLFGTSEGLQFLFVAFTCSFVAIQVMFEYREEEMRNGIYRKC